MLRIAAIWALMNLVAIAGLAGLFVGENTWAAVLRRHRPAGGARVIPISGR